MTVEKQETAPVPAPETKDAAPKEPPAKVDTKADPAPEPEKSPAEIKAEKLQAKLDAATARLKEHEDAKLSTEEKAQRELAEAKAEAAQAKTEAALVKAGVSEELHEFLSLPAGMKPEAFAAKVAKAIDAAVKARIKDRDIGEKINPPAGGTKQDTAAQGQRGNDYMALVKTRRTA